jgi:GT2 family glycosyltransferase
VFEDCRATLAAVHEAPTIAVVVPTYNRVRLALRMIDALESQRDAPPFEVVFVDDCSSDGTFEALVERSRSSSLPVTVLQTTRNAGPATARNIGWRGSSAPLVAFTDDDCVPTGEWVAGMARALDRAEIVQGRTSIDPAVTAWGAFARTQVWDTWSGYFAGCNVGYRRPLLERVGGFDEVFRRPYAEDVDLGWRAVAAGATTAFADDAVVYHDVETTGSSWRDWVNWVRDTHRMEWAALMVKRHPVMRRTMYRHWFFRVTHPPMLLASAGLCAVLVRPNQPSRWVLAAIAAVPYAWTRSVVMPPPHARLHQLKLLPLTFVGDLAQLVAILRGAIRFRVVLL